MCFYALHTALKVIRTQECSASPLSSSSRWGRREDPLVWSCLPSADLLNTLLPFRGPSLHPAVALMLTVLQFNMCHCNGQCRIEHCAMQTLYCRVPHSSVKTKFSVALCIAVHRILPKVWQKAATEFPKKIIHLRVWSTIHVLSFNPKFDLNPSLSRFPVVTLYGLITALYLNQSKLNYLLNQPSITNFINRYNNLVNPSKFPSMLTIYNLKSGCLLGL